ncbi:MAG: ABC transporter ATP-binding protein [Actinomycetes bacterium]
MSLADGTTAVVGEPILEVKGVSVNFGGVAALTAVSLDVRPGEVTGLIGPNGAGKTTLFNVISGLQRPNRGEVRLSGRDVTKLGPHRRARLGLARTFQRLELFGSLSARDNVQVGLDASRTKGDLTAQGLLHRVGVIADVDRQVSTLPTGEARLVELARALAIDPTLVLLDEPCSGLDENETEMLGGLLRELANENRAVLIVEHDMDLVLSVCDRIFVLDFGEIIASGSREDVRHDPRVQAAYLGAVPEIGEGESS